MNVITLMSLITLTASRTVVQKCWSKDDVHIGIYNNSSYQLIFANEHDTVELQCRQCTGADPNDVNIYWEKIDVTLNRTDVTHSLNTQTKSLEIGFKILDTTALFIKKVEAKHSGLYRCYVNSSSSEFQSSLTTRFESYAYFIHVGDRKNQSLNGTYTEWNYYEDYVYRSAEKMVQLIPHMNQMFKPSLIVHWSAWGYCLCGKYTYDTRSYRYAHCCVKLFDGLILPCQSSALKEIRPEVAKVLEHISKFKEYRRCMEDCIPSVVAEDEIDFKLQKTYYLPESSHQEFKCVESNSSVEAMNSTEILWIRDDNIILNKSKNALGKSSKELRVAVDSYATLYLTDVTKSEEGFYSCIDNGVPIVKIFVRIEPNNVIFSKECGHKLSILTCVIVLWIVVYSILEWITLDKNVK